MSKTIAKYHNHISLNTIEKIPKFNNIFPFASTSKNETFREVASLNISKVYEDLDIPTKII